MTDYFGRFGIVNEGPHDLRVELEGVAGWESFEVNAHDRVLGSIVIAAALAARRPVPVSCRVLDLDGEPMFEGEWPFWSRFSYALGGLRISHVPTSFHFIEDEAIEQFFEDNWGSEALPPKGS